MSHLSSLFLLKLIIYTHPLPRPLHICGHFMEVIVENAVIGRGRLLSTWGAGRPTNNKRATVVPTVIVLVVILLLLLPQCLPSCHARTGRGHTILGLEGQKYTGTRNYTSEWRMRKRKRPAAAALVLVSVSFPKAGRSHTHKHRKDAQGHKFVTQRHDTRYKAE